jgi:ectoine hydroxylase-related dioxygenase (phytanoyl-CoA dioxygenase family)
LGDRGYSIHADVFSREEISSAAAAIENSNLQRSRAGARHLLGCAAVARLASDYRMIGLASEWLGTRAIPFKATLFDKSLAANWLVAWHQDTALPMASRGDGPGWGPWSEKHGVTYSHAPARVLETVVALRLHLDDSIAENGPLRVLPGTHSGGVLTDEQVSATARRVSAVECHVAAGGVLAMRPLIIHASSKVAVHTPRRVLHLEYAMSLEPEPGMRLRTA